MSFLEVPLLPRASGETVSAQEFNQLVRALQLVLSRVQINEPLRELNAEPAKPEDGEIVIADGTDWNPGGGRGVYWYNSSGGTWDKL